MADPRVTIGGTGRQQAVIEIATADGLGYAPLVCNLSGSDPADEWETLTPHNSTNFTEVPLAIWVGVGGDLSCVSPRGTSVIKNVPDGSLLPLRPIRINLTGTTATDIVGLYRSDQ